jgi:hypothetical protein
VAKARGIILKKFEERRKGWDEKRWDPLAFATPLLFKSK